MIALLEGKPIPLYQEETYRSKKTFLGKEIDQCPFQSDFFPKIFGPQSWKMAMSWEMYNLYNNKEERNLKKNKSKLHHFPFFMLLREA